mmetsp:Transcript_44592/g.66172  ORF Transcript_44592/g.66172 Transcript_44592/m.66172 type:complete len:90 (-) Transcript_44592:226-495(-)
MKKGTTPPPHSFEDKGYGNERMVVRLLLFHCCWAHIMCSYVSLAAMKFSTVSLIAQPLELGSKTEMFRIATPPLHQRRLAGTQTTKGPS